MLQCSYLLARTLLVSLLTLQMSTLALNVALDMLVLALEHSDVNAISVSLFCVFSVITSVSPQSVHLLLPCPSTLTSLSFVISFSLRYCSLSPLPLFCMFTGFLSLFVHRIIIIFTILSCTPVCPIAFCIFAASTAFCFC